MKKLTRYINVRVKKSSLWVYMKDNKSAKSALTEFDHLHEGCTLIDKRNKSLS